MSKRIIWIDKNINNTENQIFLEILKDGIKDGIFYPVESVKEAFNLIRNRKESIDGKKEKIKIFQFRLFYVIVSGSLSNDFFNEYIKTTKELTILAATIIFCGNKYIHMKKPYYLDEFLNPGKIYDSIIPIIEYINKDENNYYNKLNLKKKIYIPEKDDFNNTFLKINNISDIVTPFLFGQLINSSFIKENDLKTFQSFLISYYPELKNYIYPSKGKKIKIPYYLLERFYAYMYTLESGFHCNMNKDLSNNKFELYCQYIFLLYDALNKKSIKSYANGDLYRGTYITKKEYEEIEKIWNEKKIFKNILNNGKINTSLYYSKAFLSFSKDKSIAYNFINDFICENNMQIPVIFKINKLNDNHLSKNEDFFISNLDLENISTFEGEKEVLILPFSCFEVISINDEFYKNKTIKIITLNYLYKYKSIIYEHIENINKKEELESFLKQVINSSFSEEIYNSINNIDIGNEIKNFIKNKFNINKEYFNFPLIKIVDRSSKITFQSSVEEYFKLKPKSIQKILIDEKIDGILISFNNGDKTAIYQGDSPDKLYMTTSGNIPKYEEVDEPFEIDNLETDEICYELIESNEEFNNGENINSCNESIKKALHKDRKLHIQNSFYYEFFTCGIILSDLIANYDEIKNYPLIEKIKSFGTFITPFVPRILSSYLPKAIVKGVPYLMAGISTFEFALSIKDIIKDDTLDESETFILITKKIFFFLCNIGIPMGISSIGFKILCAIPICPLYIVLIFSVGLGAATGYFIMNKIKNFLFKEDDENTDQLTLFSDCLYYQYIPSKFKKGYIPSLSWRGVNNKAKSFAIELVGNGLRKWLVINIPKNIRNINNDNHLYVGETIIGYKGISDNPHKVTFILYELKKRNFEAKEWGIGKKEKNYEENLSKYFTQVSILDVF